MYAKFKMLAKNIVGNDNIPPETKENVKLSKINDTMLHSDSTDLFLSDWYKYMCARISKDRKSAEFNYAPDIAHLNVFYIIAILLQEQYYHWAIRFR